MSETILRAETLSAAKRWMPVVVGVMVVVAGVAWHFLSEGQPPEEQRWANGDIHVISVAHFDEVRAYKLPAAAGATDMGAEQRGWEDPNVAVYSTPNSKPPPAPVTLEKLSDTGQAHAIDFLAKDAGKADTAWLQLAKTLTGPDGGVEKKDPYRADHVLVATVSKGLDAMPGDRLLWSRVFVQPINFEFAGYAVASTDTKTIKIADIENTNNSKLSLGYGLDTLLPGISKDTPAPSIESTAKATAAISQQYEGLGVDIRPEFLRIIRESAAGGDVVGNTAIELSMLTNPMAIWKTSLNDQGKAINDDASLALVLEDAHLTNGMNYLEEPDAKITVHPQNVLPH